MDSKERVQRAMNFEKPDRLPFNFWMERRRLDELKDKYGPRFRITHYGADILETFVGLDWPRGRFEEISGTPWMVEPFFEDWSELGDLNLPDPGVDSIYDRIRRDLKEFPDVAVIVLLPNVLSVLEGMRSQETVYMDMLTRHDEVQAFFHRVSDILQVAAERVCKLDITALCVMDDVAYNKGPFISPEDWRRMVRPHWMKSIEVAHAHDVPVFFHSDGNLEPLWDKFAEMGVRMLGPLQPTFQPIGKFKQRFDGRMGIYGGLPTDLLHQMSLEEIRKTVKELFESAGADGGLIVSSHDLDCRITEEQLDMLVNAIKNCLY